MTKTTTLTLSLRPQELMLLRRLFLIAGTVYALWWFAVRALLPLAYNPPVSRFLVVGFIFSVLIASYYSQRVLRSLRFWFFVSTWLITIHYYYLFYFNGGDLNWIMGAFITVMAINLLMISRTALLAYSTLVIILSIGLTVTVDGLEKTVFLPGLLTIMIQAYVGLNARLSLIKNLADSNEQFQQLFDSTFEGVLVHSQGKTLNVNQALVNMLGYSREELIGANIFDHLIADERELSRQRMMTAEITPYETRCMTKNRVIIDIEVRGKNFTYNKQPGRLVTIQDISDRKRAEQERIMTLSLAENLRTRDDFISIASHELKTPLSTLQLQVQLIKQDLNEASAVENLPAVISEALNLFDRQIKRLNELVETLLDVSRISTGLFNLNIKAVNLTQLINETLQRLNDIQINPYGRSELKTDLQPGLFLLGDSIRLGQVIENLITNAQKYGNGKPINVKLTQQGNQAVITVADYGLGIAPESLSRIFERFERAVSARHITGFGLGLYIAKQIVDAHNGKISVQSQLGLGTTFTVKLPLSN